MNKSRVARDLWRKVFNDNLIDLKDGDARKQVVREFLNDPVNKKAGWKSKDARFMRLGFQKVAKENNFNVMNIGVTPTPSRTKTQKGSMSINIKSKQKNPPPMGESIKPPTEEQKKFGALPQTPQLENQQAQATYYTAQSVGQIFETIVNIISARTGCSPLSQNERIALGEAWMPIFVEYFSGENSKWVMVAIITIPIALRILSEIQQKKKKKELEEKYGIEDIPKDLPKKKSSWENMSHGKNETNKK
jgi:hypothetical protein|tara:strand:+ start:322 stop:1065 length:744 start_codon:yes stop_codon:yes gene_type:complete